MSFSRAHFESELKDAISIANYVESLSSYDVDKDFIEEYFRGCHAVLKWVPLDYLTEGNSDTNLRDDNKEQLYMTMSEYSCPPILVEEGVIQDGNYRFRVARNNGYLGIWAYEVKEIPEASLSLAYKPKRRL